MVIQDLKVLYGADNPLFSKEKKTLQDIPKTFSWLFKFFHTISRINKLNIPIEEYLRKKINNQSLLDIFYQHFFKGTSSFFALSYFAFYNDYLYPEKKVGELTEKLSEKIIEFNGNILYNTQINKIYPSEKIVEDTKGNRYKYKKLIWAADLKRFYNIIDIKSLPEKIFKNFNLQKENIIKSKGAESVFSIFLAINEPIESFSNISSGHIFYTPSRKGLNDTNRERLKEILSKWDQIEKKDIISWAKDFVKLNTFEVSIPAIRNIEAAPSGKTAVIISMLIDYEIYKKVENDGWFEEFKSILEDNIIDVFSSSLYPFIKDKIIFKFSASPLTLERYVDSSEGSIVGWSFEDRIPVVSNMLKMQDLVKTLINDIYVAGKWVYSPAGGPTAIMTGRIASNLALKSLKNK